MTKTIYRNALCILLCLLLVAFYFSPKLSLDGATKNKNTTEQQVAPTELPAPLDSPTVSIKETIVRKVGAEGSIKSDFGKFNGSKQQQFELDEWKAQRGYTDGVGANEYSNYSADTLKKLADDGDIKAMHALAQLYVTDRRYVLEYGWLGARKLLLEAAAYGSTRALQELGRNYYHAADVSLASPDEQKHAIIEEYSFYAAATKRGDRMPLYSSLPHLESVYNINFNDDDWRLISERASEIYQNLEVRRKELGLDSFDNSVPETVKNYFDQFYPESVNSS